MSSSHPRVPLALALVFGASVPLLQACEQVTEACNLECPAQGVLDGNASISGLTSVDAFFAAVVGFHQASLEVRTGVNAELRAIAGSLELDVAATPADIRAAIAAKLEAHVEGGLKIEYAAPRCTVDAEVAVAAAARCDADVDPGSAKIECKGTCTVDASAGASCEADATVICKGTAPALKCDGTCTGTCELTGSLQCNGTCTGGCEGTCTVLGADGQCAGECTGECTGSCELRAGAACEGACQGSCEYEAPDGKCEADAELRCQASADASASCEGSCDGEVVPPKARAECEASVDAEARVRAECTPPSLEIRWQWKAGVEADAQARFKAWVAGFRGRYAGLLAASARAELVLGAGAGLGQAAVDLIAGLPSELAGEASLRATAGLRCALPELEAVADAVGGASTALSGSVSAVAEVSAAFAGG